jgi:hypothetical protein
LSGRSNTGDQDPFWAIAIEEAPAKSPKAKRKRMEKV